MNNRIQFTTEPFTTYLSRKEIGLGNLKKIKELLLSQRFILADPYDDGNNYQHFEDELGILKFNNPNMELSTGHVTAAITTPDGEGNTLRFSNLLILTGELLKEDILKQLVKIEQNFKDLDAEKKELNEKLGYLLFINSDVLNEESYLTFKRDQVEQTLLLKT
ncbi:MAG: hypothetical protein ACSLE0_15365 [Chitinophagaceae bacterium]